MKVRWKESAAASGLESEVCRRSTSQLDPHTRNRQSLLTSSFSPTTWSSSITWTLQAFSNDSLLLLASNCTLISPICSFTSSAGAPYAGNPLLFVCSLVKSTVPLDHCALSVSNSSVENELTGSEWLLVEELKPAGTGSLGDQPVLERVFCEAERARAMTSDKPILLVVIGRWWDARERARDEADDARRCASEL